MEKKDIVIVVGLIVSACIYVLIAAMSLYSMTHPGFSIIPQEYWTQWIYILPGPFITDIILLYAIPIGFFALFYALAPLVTAGWIKIHKLMAFKKKKYGIYEMGKKVPVMHLFKRAFVISLFAFSIAALIISSTNSVYLFRYSKMIPTDALALSLHSSEAIFLATFLIAPIVILLFFPIWSLEDSGVIAYKVRPDERISPDIEGVHAIFLNLLQGYAGFTTILALITQIAGNFIAIWNSVPPPQLENFFRQPALLTPIILIILPFIVTGLLAGPILLYEKTLPKIKEKLHKRLLKQDFVKIRIPEFDEITV